MSLVSVKVLECNGCGITHRLKNNTLTREWFGLRSEGWTRRRGKHWCPACGLGGEKKQARAEAGA